MTIEFRDVHASYDRTIPILKGVSFAIDDGEFVSFVGTNGAGKSTTMRLINGLLKPEQGDVLVDGVPTTQLKTSELARRVGFLFQNPDNQICSNTVREELLFGFRALGRLDADAEQRVDDVIAEFGFNPDDDPFLLNRGTRQLLALASIVVLDTPVIVLDEPTTGLDFRECVKVMDIIRHLHEQGTTVIMVCHDMEVVADFAERVIVMSDGRVVDDGPTFEVLRNRKTLERASLIPPQIVDISLAMTLVRPELVGSPIGCANTLNDMQSAIEASCGSPRIPGILGQDFEIAVQEGAPGAQELEPHDAADGLLGQFAQISDGPGNGLGRAGILGDAFSLDGGEGGGLDAAGAGAGDAMSNIASADAAAGAGAKAPSGFDVLVSRMHSDAELSDGRQGEGAGAESVHEESSAVSGVADDIAAGAGTAAGACAGAAAAGNLEKSARNAADALFNSPDEGGVR